MRDDLAGLFWDDTPVVKEKKEKIKRTAPERVWESDDYLPGLAEAQAFDVPLFTDQELLMAWQANEPLILDTESYPNYWMIGFKSTVSGKVLTFELHEDASELDIAKLRWILTSFTIIGFNSYSYDLPVTTLALEGYTTDELYDATCQIIQSGVRGYQLLKVRKVKQLEVDHIDLIEVAPLSANLKIYAGRLHAPRMQDLPFKPGTILTEDQKTIVRWYNVASDLPATALMYQELKEQLELRVSLSKQYKMDLRSKSDAQIAEAVIGKELARITGKRATRPEIEPGTSYKYQVPAFLTYRTSLLNWTLDMVRQSDFTVAEDGTIGMPHQLKDLKLDIAGTVYRMGIGGLHSSEQCSAHYADENYLLKDRDVTGYYPRIIINLGLYPKHLGPDYTQVYSRIVTRRVYAKQAGDNIVSDCLKIVVNGGFGKYGSPWSIFYAPELLVQVTLTGQLALLMLVERLELEGIHVVSANTDGIVIKCLRSMEPLCDAIVAQWEKDTNFETEETLYRAIYSRDVNNYVAVKTNNKVKSKGAYSNPWSDPKLAIFRFHKNPVTLICTEAVEAYLALGTPIVDTVRACRDVRKFVTVRAVRGGAAQDGVFLGKAVRWYYSTERVPEMQYASNGNKVPRSDGAKPVMDLPAELPVDVDFDWYVQEARSMVERLGLMPPE